MQTAAPNTVKILFFIFFIFKCFIHKWEFSGRSPQCVNVLICQCANALRHENTPKQTQRSPISTLAH